MKGILYFILGLLPLSIFSQERLLQVEPNHSTIGFEISIAGFTKVTGKFMDFSIDIDWQDTNIPSSSIKAKINVESIDTGIDDRDKHLRSADFFDAENYPQITFVSDSIKQIGYAKYNAYGIMEMRGVNKAIVLPFHIVKMDDNTIGISSKTSIKRLDFNIGTEFRHTTMPDFLANEVTVNIDFWTKKRKLD